MKTAATTDIPATPPKEPYVDVKPAEAGAAPAPVPANPAVPAPLPPERLDYSSDRAPTEQLMAQNNVTPTQLSKGNDPAFGPTIEARSTAEKNEAQAAATYRKDESKIGASALAHAQLAVAHGLGAMHYRPRHASRQGRRAATLPRNRRTRRNGRRSPKESPGSRIAPRPRSREFSRTWIWWRQFCSAAVSRAPNRLTTTLSKRPRAVLGPG